MCQLNDRRPERQNQDGPPQMRSRTGNAHGGVSSQYDTSDPASVRLIPGNSPPLDATADLNQTIKEMYRTHGTLRRRNREKTGCSRQKASLRGVDDVGRLCCHSHHHRGSSLSGDEDVNEELHQYIRRELGPQMANSFAFANIDPPITKKSLSELDVNTILANAKLRHDVNFDRELHFRPNLDGDKGRRKIREAEDYWMALRAELELYQLLFHGRDPNAAAKFSSWPRPIDACKRRVPVIFETIKGILKDLVPARDQPRVEEQLDLPVLMQQIEKGVCDLVKLSQWLSQLLKEHCAPMRDVWVDKMVEQTQIGMENSNSESVVAALRELLGILEAMKLDVANHQIRNVRAILIESTIEFEREYHLGRIARKRLNVDHARQWFLREAQIASGAEIIQSPGGNSDPQLEVLVKGIMRILFAFYRSSKDTFPETFNLDLDRLVSLKIELLDEIYVDMCLKVFGMLLGRLGYAGSPRPSAYQFLSQSLLAITLERATNGPRQWIQNFPNIAGEISRQALHICGRPDTYDPESVRWVEEQLYYGLFTPYCGLFRMSAINLSSIMTSKVLKLVQHFRRATPGDIHNALVVNYHALSPSFTISQHSLDPSMCHPRGKHLDDIIRRISHIAILHWQSWSPIYNDEQTNAHTIDTRSDDEVPTAPTTPEFVAHSSNLSMSADSSTALSLPPSAPTPPQSNRTQPPTPEAIDGSVRRPATAPPRSSLASSPAEMQNGTDSTTDSTAATGEQPQSRTEELSQR